jgi:hypothetical protein
MGKYTTRLPLDIKIGDPKNNHIPIYDQARGLWNTISSSSLIASSSISASAAISSSYAVSASYVISAPATVSSSYALSSSFATTASYVAGTVASAFNIDIYEFVGNGNETIFNIIQTYNINSLLVTIDGLTLNPEDDFTLSANNLQFVTAPPSESTVLVRAFVNATTGVTGSFNGILIGTASFATSASFAPTILPSGLISSSMQINTGSFTGSFIGAHSGSTLGTASFATTSSYALSASYALNAPASAGGAITIDSYTFTGNGSVSNYTLDKTYDISSLIVTVGGLTQTSTIHYTLASTTLSFLVAPPSQSNILVRAIVNVSTGSVGSFSGSFIGTHSGSTFGTASWAINAITASFVSGGSISGTVTSASYALSASFATTASYALSSSFATTASFVSGGSISGTVTSASYALSASFATTASHVTGTVTSASFATTASNLIGGSVNYIPLWTSATAQSTATIYQRSDNGNIGIGTGDPSASLHVFAGGSSNTLPTNAQGIFEFSANGGIAISTPAANVAGVYFPRLTDAYYSGIEKEDTVLRLKNNGTTAVTINSAANVGIGTTTPGALLHVQGAISGSTMTLTGTATVQTLVETSTQELKKNITAMESTVTTLSKLEPSRFNWISTDEPDIGLIAEQVEQIFPELVTHAADGKLIGVKYSKLTVLLLKAVQEMSQRIESLEQQSIYKHTH